MATHRRGCGHEQLILNGERFRKQIMIDLEESQQPSLKTSYVPPQGFLGPGELPVEVRSWLSIMAETVFFSSPLADSGR